MRLPSPTVRVEFKPQDLWVGAYWDVREDFLYRRFVHVWICLLPMVPLHVWWPLAEWETR